MRLKFDKFSPSFSSLLLRFTFTDFNISSSSRHNIIRSVGAGGKEIEKSQRDFTQQLPSPERHQMSYGGSSKRFTTGDLDQIPSASFRFRLACMPHQRQLKIILTEYSALLARATMQTTLDEISCSQHV